MTKSSSSFHNTIGLIALALKYAFVCIDTG